MRVDEKARKGLIYRDSRERGEERKGRVATGGAKGFSFWFFKDKNIPANT